MKADQALVTLDEFLNQDDEPVGVWPDEARKALDTVRLQLAEFKRANRVLIVENEALKAELAAVPMAALLYRLANSEQSPECWGDWDNRGEAYEKASNEIDAWLKKVTK